MATSNRYLGSKGAFSWGLWTRPAGSRQRVSATRVSCTHLAVFGNIAPSAAGIKSHERLNTTNALNWLIFNRLYHVGHCCHRHLAGYPGQQSVLAQNDRIQYNVL